MCILSVGGGSNCLPFPWYALSIDLCIFLVYLCLCEAGSTGATPLAIGGGSIGDLFSERDRALAMAVYVLGPLIGKVHHSGDMKVVL